MRQVCGHCPEPFAIRQVWAEAVTGDIRIVQYEQTSEVIRPQVADQQAFPMVLQMQSVCGFTLGERDRKCARGRDEAFIGGTRVRLVTGGIDMKSVALETGEPQPLEPQTVQLVQHEQGADFRSEKCHSDPLHMHQGEVRGGDTVARGRASEGDQLSQ
ncbi:hypothetical protein C8263_15400 [Deinococcus arcticus]|uniref:Uncharacterized protein n=1 Tax=Deinococcus arcticus TaxID=2136176 RepID=A0A2T3W4Y5_9DEIO|nr:hypothetical protein C8263_15400 [Deinococcus arcticus]